MKGHRGHVGQQGMAVSRVESSSMVLLLFYLTGPVVAKVAYR